MEVNEVCGGRKGQYLNSTKRKDDDGDGHTLYFGASLRMKSCGPAMLPAQYPMKKIAFTVAFLVNPPILLDMMLRSRGNTTLDPSMRRTPT